MILMANAMMGAAGYQAAGGGAGFRYARLIITSLINESKTYGQLSEVEFREQSGDVYVPVVSVSSPNIVLSGFEVDNLFDRDVSDSSRWLPRVTSLPHEFTVDFGSIVNPDKLILFNYANNHQDRAPKDFYLEGSTDGVSWFSVFSAQTDAILIANMDVPHGYTGLSQEFYF